MSDDLKDEVLAIVEQLSRDELRVFRFMGRRMIDIGHAKYGPLDLAKHDRVWSREMAQETADRLFYAQCQEIAKEDRRAEGVNHYRNASNLVALAAENFALNAVGDRLDAPSPGIRVSPTAFDLSAEDKACTECYGINGTHAAGCGMVVLR